jgi:DNA repair exonuclease SbcCD ATPase subunit
MKITRIKLVNFIGIKHGADLDEIEINFGDKKIVMLNGKNGSGKSTILSQLHPFKDSFDDRKSVIANDEDGIKEIDIEHEGNLYEIVHNYGKKATSFIKKNGEEMNENGGVRTFNSFVESEFGLTSDYFKIGKIGSNTENFIQLTTADRKSYISKFLPAIEDYLQKFKIVKDKFLESQKDLKAISTDLSRLEDREIIEKRIETYEGLLSKYESELIKTSNKVAVLESEIETYQKDVEGKSVSDMILEINEKQKQIRDIELFAVNFINDYGKLAIEELEEYIEKNSEIAISLGEEVASLKSEKTGLKERLISLDNEVSKLNYKLKEIETTEDPIKLQESINTIEANIQNIQEDSGETIIAVRNFRSEISGQIYKYNSFKKFLLKYYEELKSNTMVASRSNIEMFMGGEFIESLNSQADTLRNLIQSKQEILEESKVELGRKEADYQKFSEIYKDKDIDGLELIEECRNCPLAKEALSFAELPEQMKVLEESIRSMKKDLQDFENKAENLTELKRLNKEFNSLYEEMNPRINQVYISLLKRVESLMNLFSNDFNTVSSHFSVVEVDFENALTKLQLEANLKSELDALKYRKGLIDNNQEFRKGYEESIKDKEDKKIQINEDMIKKDQEIVEKEKQKNKKSIDLNNYKTHLEGRRKRNSLKTTISQITSEKETVELKLKAINEKTQEKNLIEINLVEIKTNKNQTSTELINLKTNLNKVVNLEERKERVDADYNQLRLIKDSLDPNKGIPLYFIKAYLEKTKDIANELLDLAFDGDFEINFFTNEKEFFIQVRVDEDVKNDIKEASQGEIALTTISISLALIEQAIGKYNILALDEIDGPLDNNNRENFISILNKQIDKLGIEQVFVISHNDAFDTEEMDLILLKGSNVDQKGENFMKNKNIIFEVK